MKNRCDINRRSLMKFTMVQVAFIVATTIAMGDKHQLSSSPLSPADSKKTMSYLDNGSVRIGVDLALGGVITYLADSKKKINLVNSYDWGRQIQMSFYSGPVPYKPGGKEPSKNWVTIGWNPIQTGDVFGNRSQILEHNNDGKRIYIKCRPMHWPLDNEPGECTFESWLELKSNTVHVTSRINNARTDKTQYPARHQELPAVYTNGPWWRLFTYTGSKPFTGDKLTQITKRWATEQDLLEGNVWDNWLSAERWAALVDDTNWGLGLWQPNSIFFSGGFFGTPNQGGPKDSPCGYLGPNHREVLDHDIQYEYNYVLILGTLDDIRAYVYTNADRDILPDYRFVSDRQHWYFVNASDAGWPIKGCLDIQLSDETSQIIGPYDFWNAEDAKKLYISAAFNTSSNLAKVFWKLLDDKEFSAEKSIEFAVIPDGAYHTYTIDLSSHPDYAGGVKQIRIDPTTSPKPGQSVKIKEITFSPHSPARSGIPQTAKEKQMASEEHNEKKHWSQWERVKVAAAQVEIHTDTQIDRIVEFIDRAGADKAQMIVLGEYLLGPFYRDTSPAVERVAEAAQRNHIYVVVGGWEEFKAGAYAAKKKNAYANTVLIFDRQGKIVGKYQKTHKAIGAPPHFWPPKGNEDEWLMKPGDGYPTFQLDFARVGIMTCYDGYFPESASCLSLSGAEIVLWLNGRAGPVEEFVVQTDIFRNYCAMISTNLGPGSGTMIGTWPANILAKITETGNHYITAELNLKDLRYHRTNSRVFHQRRPDIYGPVTRSHQPWKVYEHIEGMVFEGYPSENKSNKEL